MAFRRLPRSTPTSLLLSHPKRGGIGTACTCVSSRTGGRRRIFSRPNYQRQRVSSRPAQVEAQATGVDVARFGLLSIVSLPFTIWSAAFTYDYLYRVKICQAALERQDEDLLGDKGGSTRIFLGREKELAEVSSLLDQEPTQIIVIAGGNEKGKSRFVKELIRDTQQNKSRGVTLVQLAQFVDSVSLLTQVFVNACDLRWLQLRHALVDVLPFAGSEILVMKERFSDRDFAQALAVITDALKRIAKKSGPDMPRPVIVIDGLGEGTKDWMESAEGKLLAQRLLQWCIYVTKERRLAHIILTGSEHLVLSLTDQNRATRGHVRVVGMGDVDIEDAAKIVKRELPDLTVDEVRHITDTFGGFIHDLIGVSRDIKYRISQADDDVGSKKRKAIIDEVVKTRFHQQVERVVSAFAVSSENNSSNKNNHTSQEEVDDMDPYLDPLKSIYSEAKARQASNDDMRKNHVNWTQLQLWQTLKRFAESSDMAIPFSELRDDVFGGDKTPVLELMAHDVLSFEVNRSSDGGWFWKVTPSSPALGLAFSQIVKNGALKETFQKIEDTEKRNAEKQSLELEQARLNRERKYLDLRKKSLLQTIELGKEIGQEGVARERLATAFRDIVSEEEKYDMDDQFLRNRLSLLAACNDGNDVKAAKHTEEHAALHHISHQDDQLSLKHLLKSVVRDIMSTKAGSGDNQFLQLKNAFDLLDKTNDGKLSAEDVVRVVRELTNYNVSMKAAERFVEEWDLNDDEGLDFSEFVHLILSDEKEQK